MYAPFDSVPKRRAKKDTPLQQAEKLISLALNGGDDFNEETVGTLCILVRGNQKLQRKRSVLTGLHKAYTQWCQDEKSPQQQKDCIDLGLTLLECAPNFKKFKWKYNKKLYKRMVKRDTFYASLIDGDNPMPVRQRALEICDWSYYHPTKMYSPHRENPFQHGFKDIEQAYSAAFRKNAKGVTMQERLFHVLEKAAEPTPEKHYACLREEEFMTLLNYPMMKSKDNTLQVSAVKLGYAYIDADNQEPSPWLAASLQDYATMIAPICPKEAAWLTVKSELTKQEAELAIIHEKFFEDLKEPLKKKDYPTVQTLFEAHNKNFTEKQAAVVAARQNFADKHPVPDMFTI